MLKAYFYYYLTWILLCRILRTMRGYVHCTGHACGVDQCVKTFHKLCSHLTAIHEQPLTKGNVANISGWSSGAHMKKQLQRPFLKLIVGREKVDGDEWLRTKETFHVASPILSMAIWHKEWKLWVSTLNFLPVFDPRRNYKSAPPTLAASTCNSRALTPAVLSFAMVR